MSILSDEKKREFMIEKGFDYVQKFTDRSVFEQIMNVYKTKV
ncbi:hypothetical protein CCAN12_540035 [Capnocytophaga canimorsus]|uniref:Uncharacterized protein n=1 Tax=Capnocytophaga canimorsus TaxID=28188 RepID=A0A0B7H5H3_9FLAO|nr:hypothetical protein CCAN12_540035 [Capnocytophaga canimorsus]